MNEILKHNIPFLLSRRSHNLEIFLQFINSFIHHLL